MSFDSFEAFCIHFLNFRPNWWTGTQLTPLFIILRSFSPSIFTNRKIRLGPCYYHMLDPPSSTDNLVKCPLPSHTYYEELTAVACSTNIDHLIPYSAWPNGRINGHQHIRQSLRTSQVSNVSAIMPSKKVNDQVM